ncbi:MAG: transaldolase, partial [Dehalococcoidia bacterium]|nr:transaldolase [Dehalococcoidia bacterium]
ADLAHVYPGPIFYQPTAQTMTGILEEAERALRIAPDRIVCKLPATMGGFQAGARLRGQARFGFTAIYTPAQAAVAGATGASYILPYYHRMTRLLGDGDTVLRQMAQIAKPMGVELLVASIKTPEEAVAALLAGADHITAPLAVLEAMAASPLTDAAMDEFRRAAV